MRKEQVKGKADEIAGRARRQASEWTGDLEGQVRGAFQEIKGKGEIAVGKMKQAGQKIQRDMEREQRDSEAPASETASETTPREKNAA